MDFINIAKQRHSVRSYTNQKVEPEKLEQILEAAHVAPTAANLQPVHLLVVQSEEGLAKISKAAGIYGAPLAIIVCADHNKAWTRPFDKKQSGDIDASILTDHMMLQATELGLGTVWVCYFQPDVLKQEFNLPANLEPVNILVVGYSDEEDADTNAEKYLRIVFAGSLFVNFFQSANMVIRGEGQLKKAMTIIASGAILNIILDPIFITILNPYGMGIEAAAYATVLSQFIQAAVTLWYFRKKSPNVKIGRIRIDGTLLPQVLSVGVSALLMQILTLVQQTVIYRVASNYGGETSQLLLGAALRFWNFSFVPLWGISQGFQPAAGTNYGAKDYDRVKKLTKVFIIAATLLSLVFYIPVELFPEKILSMFLTTPGIAASGATNFRIMFSTYILQGSFLIAVTLFQSLGKANKATWLVLFRQIILFIPLCVILPMIGGMGIRGVWLAIALTDAILVIITISMMLYEFGKMPATSSVKR